MKPKIDEVLKRYPIAHELAGWYFRIEETAPDQWRAIGVDLIGNRVIAEGRTSDVLLQCVSDAKCVADQR